MWPGSLLVSALADLLSCLFKVVTAQLCLYLLKVHVVHMPSSSLCWNGVPQGAPVPPCATSNEYLWSRLISLMATADWFPVLGRTEV